MQLKEFKVGDKVSVGVGFISVSGSRYHIIRYIGKMFAVLQPENAPIEYLYPVYDETWKYFVPEKCDSCGRENYAD